MTVSRQQVTIIGSGPSGLATAIELKRLGVEDVVIIEREASAGGIPRHCGHSPYGMREFRRLLSGPEYARRLTRQAIELGVNIRLECSVVDMQPSGSLTLSTPAGVEKLNAERVVICTGNREMPRSARLVSGSRPPGVVTTGALQSMVYLKKRIPFRKPVIVGSELIAFSALLTCRHAGIKPVAMIESESRITAWRFAALLPRLSGCKLMLNHSIKKIHGQSRVESVAVENVYGDIESIDCDGVVFSGRFVAEDSLIRSSHLQIDAQGAGPVIDQYGRCSDPAYFACGNLTHPVDTAGWCWDEGRRMAGNVHASLNGHLHSPESNIDIEYSNAAIKYLTPQRLACPAGTGPIQNRLQLRFREPGSGLLSLQHNGQSVTHRKFRTMPERRVLLPLPDFSGLSSNDSLSLEFFRN